MRETRLFESSILTIREIVCNAARGHGKEAERNQVPCIAIPIRGCYAVERNREETVADTNTAIFFDTKSAYRVSHPADEGDVTVAITLNDASFAAAFGDLRPACAPLNARDQLELHLLRRHVNANRDPLAAEEAALAVVRSIAGTARVALSHKSSAAVERAKAFLGERYSEKVLLEDVAGAAKCSPFTLARAFPVATGMSLHRYLLALRHSAALHAIAGGASDLSRLAADSGFAHHSHLTKTFARAFGATPSRIRARFLK